MKIDFPLPEDNAYHELCINCHTENVSSVKEDGKEFYLCSNCGEKSARLLVLDPKIVWGIDPQTKEYWHESVGIFVFNPEGKALFFQRNKFPFALTIPAGHLDAGETPDDAIKRELSEETGLVLDSVKFFVSEGVLGDKCRRGADNHRWHLFTGLLKIPQDFVIDTNEGSAPTWISLEEANKQELPVPVRHFIEKYGDKLKP